jgi:dTDP-glucose 4,6-dehydratase
MTGAERSGATVVVIGSNSFSGGDFVDLLLEERAYRVVGVSRSEEKSRLYLAYRDRADLSRFEFHRMDLNHDMDALCALLAELRPAYVVNFSSQSEVAPSWDHPEQWFQTNAVAIARLGNFLKDQSWLERYVHISTPEVYGSCTGTITESAPMDPSTPYAASRAAGEMMLRTLVKSFDFPLAVVRSTNVYGAHQQVFKIIPRAVIYVKMGRRLPLHGGGRHVRSFIHIRDVSRGELAVMEGAGRGEVYNLSPDGGAPVREVVARICDRLGVDIEAVTESVGERTGQDAVYVIDSSKARAEFGWAPRIDLDAGVAEVVDWVERDWDLILREPLEYVHKP